jgi:hypothetical protein
MLPTNTASTLPVGGLFLPPDSSVTTPLVDYERGGIAINNTSQGLLTTNWKCWMEVYDVMLQPEGGDPILLFTEIGITELALCFDQNMRWSVAYIHNGILKLRWFDTVVSAYVTTVFSTAVNPKMCLDDKRISQLGSSDMLLVYIKDRKLCYRQQRDRFTIERILKSDLFPNAKLKNIGMTKNLRIQFELV